MIQSPQDILNNLQEDKDLTLNSRVLIVDGMNTFIRSFVTIQSINPKGHHIGGLTGFLKSVAYNIRILDPTRVIIVWDGKGSSTNRKNIDSNYKATRGHRRITNWQVFDDLEEEYDSMQSQVERVKDYLGCLPVINITMDKLEADDVMAYMAKKFAENGNKATIVSSDRDFLQLIRPNLEVYSPIKKKMFTVDNIKTELGVLPDNYNIVKALLGDNSDNLPGIKGLGIKTVQKEFPKLLTDTDVTLDYIYKICEEKMDDKKIFPKIIYFWDKVLTNFTLMDLHEDSLDEREEEIVRQHLQLEVPPLRRAAFMHFLDQDKIESITKNTDNWLQNFSKLERYISK